MFRNALGLASVSRVDARAFPGSLSVGRFAAAPFDPERGARRAAGASITGAETRLGGQAGRGLYRLRPRHDRRHGGSRSLHVTWIPEHVTRVVTGLLNVLSKVLAARQLPRRGRHAQIDDLAVAHGVADGPADYTARCSPRQRDGHLTPLGGAASFAVPARSVPNNFARAGSYSQYA